MNPLKKGMIIKNELGEDCKVIEVLGDIVFKSTSYSYEETDGSAYTYQELIADGFTWEEEAWEPQPSETYYFINSKGKIGMGNWLTKNCHNRKDFLGIFQTEEKAEQALQEIKRKLGK